MKMINICLAIGLVSCGPNSNGKAPLSESKNPEVRNPSINGNGTENSDDSSDGTVAKESFLKTLASNTKKINLVNIVVEFKKINSKTGAGKEFWTANCLSSRQATINGSYPIVNLSIGLIDCGITHTPLELIRLLKITNNLSYSAHHIPSYPSEPNQFQLRLQNPGTASIHWKSVESLNANMKERNVYLDFYGEQKSLSDWREDASHFIQISLNKSDEGISEILTLQYSFDRPGREESTEIVITADVERES